MATLGHTHTPVWYGPNVSVWLEEELAKVVDGENTQATLHTNIARGGGK